MKTYQELSKIIVRISMSLVFLYFGYQQITSPESWMGIVPDIVLLMGISAKNIVILNSILELSLGTLLLLGLYTRAVSLVLSIHLFLISFNFGFEPVGVRDFGLAVTTLSIFFSGQDNFSLDNKLKKKL